jgi:hypothetical protein
MPKQNQSNVLEKQKTKQKRVENSGGSIFIYCERGTNPEVGPRGSSKLAQERVFLDMQTANYYVENWPLLNELRALSVSRKSRPTIRTYLINWGIFVQVNWNLKGETSSSVIIRLEAQPRSKCFSPNTGMAEHQAPTSNISMTS